ncbi:MAG: FG-GAP repeat protein [Planctomycetota bacterium]
MNSIVRAAAGALLPALLLCAASAHAQAPVTFEQSIYARETANFGYQGRSFVAEGDTLVVGNWGDGQFGQNSGAARVYERTASGWKERFKLIAEDASTQAYFGMTVAMSGDTIAVGAYKDNAGGRKCGAAYVFRLIDGAWKQLAKLTPNDGVQFDQFSFSLAVLDGVVIATAPYADANGEDSGAAYVFTEQPNGAWIQTQKLTPNDARPHDRFGLEAAAQGTTAMIGAHWSDVGAAADAGAMYVFDRNAAGSWQQSARLTSLDADPGDWFGISVAMDGDTAVIGARADSEAAYYAGAAYVFERAGGVWTQRQKLLAGDPDEIDFFGNSVDVRDGAILVGACLDDDLGYWSGSAYLFEPVGGRWSQTAKLVAPDGGMLDYFGVDVAITGCDLLVSAPEHEPQGFVDTGVVYSYNRCPVRVSAR